MKKYISRKFLTMAAFLVMANILTYQGKIPWWGWLIANLFAVFGYHRTLYAFEKIRKSMMIVTIIVMLSVTISAATTSFPAGYGRSGVAYPVRGHGFACVIKNSSGIVSLRIVSLAGKLVNLDMNSSDPLLYFPILSVPAGGDADNIAFVRMNGGKAKLILCDVSGKLLDSVPVDTVDRSYRYKSIAFAGGAIFYQSGHQAEHEQYVAAYKVAKNGKLKQLWTQRWRGIASAHGFTLFDNTIQVGSYVFGRNGFEGFAMLPALSHVDITARWKDYAVYFVEGSPAGVHLFRGKKRIWSRTNDCPVAHAHAGWVANVTGDETPEIYAMRKGATGMICPKIYDFSGKAIRQGVEYNSGALRWDSSREYRMIARNTVVSYSGRNYGTVPAGIGTICDVDGDGLDEYLTVNCYAGKVRVTVTNFSGNVTKIVNSINSVGH